MGSLTDKQIIELITEKDNEIQEVYFNLYEFEVKNTNEAKDYIGKKASFR